MTSASSPQPGPSAAMASVRSVAPAAAAISAVLAVAGGSGAAAVFALSSVVCALLGLGAVARGAASRSALVLGAGAALWLAGWLVGLFGAAGPWWAFLGAGVVSTVGLLAAVGLRALAKPVGSAPSESVVRALEVISNVTVERPEGMSGLVLATEQSTGKRFLVGEVPGDADTFEESLPYREFTAVLARVRHGAQVAPGDLRGVVVIPDLDKFGPLRMKGADEVVACSKSRLRTALTPKLRGH